MNFFYQALVSIFLKVLFWQGFMQFETKGRKKCKDSLRHFRKLWVISSNLHRHPTSPISCLSFDLSLLYHPLILSIFQRVHDLCYYLFLWSILSRMDHGNLSIWVVQSVLSLYRHLVKNFSNQSQTTLTFLVWTIIQKSMKLALQTTTHINLHQRILDCNIDMFRNNQFQ